MKAVLGKSSERIAEAKNTLDKMWDANGRVTPAVYGERLLPPNPHGPPPHMIIEYKCQKDGGDILLYYGLDKDPGHDAIQVLWQKVFDQAQAEHDATVAHFNAIVNPVVQSWTEGYSKALETKPGQPPSQK